MSPEIISVTRKFSNFTLFTSPFTPYVDTWPLADSKKCPNSLLTRHQTLDGNPQKFRVKQHNCVTLMNNVQIWKSVCKASCWHKHCQWFVFACSSSLLTLLDSVAINLHEKCLTFRSRFWKLLNYNPIVYCLLRRTISSKYPRSLFFLVGFLPTFSLRFIVKEQAEHNNGTLTWQSHYQVINVLWNLTETFQRFKPQLDVLLFTYQLTQEIISN